MKPRAIAYLILWVVILFIMIRSCSPDDEVPAEVSRDLRVETFDDPEVPPEETIVVETDLLWMEWSRRGAGCKTIRLKQFTGQRVDSGEITPEDWLTVYQAVPAYAPSRPDLAESKHHRRGDALPLTEPAGTLEVDLDAMDWDLTRNDIEGGGTELLFEFLTPKGVYLQKKVRVLPGSHHLFVEVLAESKQKDVIGRDLVLRLGTGGGILREEDRFYRNPYVAAALWKNNRVDDLKTFYPDGDLPRWRQSVARWSPETAFVVEGSKYFLNALVALDRNFNGAVVENLFDDAYYEEQILKGLEESEIQQMTAISNAYSALFQETGSHPSGEELVRRSGLEIEPAQALVIYSDYFARARKALGSSWQRASIGGNFSLHLRGLGEPAERRSFLWYLGPKDPKVLNQEPHAVLSHIVDEVDYGDSFFYKMFFTNAVAKVILGLLRFFHSLVGNWGVAIILMTMLVRLCLFPITRMSQVKMAQYQAKIAKIKPQLDAVKKKYANDRQKMNEETMKLYQKHKLGPPLGGCLPILLQFPVFIGLFAALRCSILLRQQPFTGWIQDLSRPDALIDFGGPILDVWPFTGVVSLNVLPILMVILWVAQQRTMPKPADPQQAQMQKIMTFMPILFGLLLYNYAAGLSLYMITSSSIGIFEIKVIKKKWPVKVDGVPATPETPPGTAAPAKT